MNIFHKREKYVKVTWKHKNISGELHFEKYLDGYYRTEIVTDNMHLMHELNADFMEQNRISELEDKNSESEVRQENIKAKIMINEHKTSNRHIENT